MKLNQIADRPGARTFGKRVGRGIGSGKGKTAGRGVKGQKSRTGVRIKGFEGGQMPIYRRLPKRGFANIFALHLNEVNLGRVQTAIDKKQLDPAKPVTVEALVAAGVLNRALDGVRLLGGGELKAKVAFEVHGASKSAAAVVEKLGGSVKRLAPAKKKRVSGEDKKDAKKEAKKQAKPKQAPAATEAGGEAQS